MKKTVSLLLALMLFLMPCMSTASADTANETVRLTLSSDLFDVVNGMVVSVTAQKQPQPALNLAVEKNGESLLDLSAVLDSESKALYLTGDVIGGSVIGVSADELAALADAAVLSLLEQVKSLIDSGAQSIENGAIDGLFANLFDAAFRKLQSGEDTEKRENVLLSALEKFYAVWFRMMSRTTAEPVGDGLTRYTMTLAKEDMVKMLEIEKLILSPIYQSLYSRSDEEIDEIFSLAADAFSGDITYAFTVTDDLDIVSAVMDEPLKSVDMGDYHVTLSVDHVKNDEKDSFGFKVASYTDDAGETDFLVIESTDYATGDGTARLYIPDVLQMDMTKVAPTETHEGSMNIDLNVWAGEEAANVTVSVDHLTVDGSAVPEIDLRVYGVLIAAVTVEKGEAAREIGADPSAAAHPLSMTQEELAAWLQETEKAVMNWLPAAALSGM